MTCEYRILFGFNQGYKMEGSGEWEADGDTSSSAGGAEKYTKYRKRKLYVYGMSRQLTPKNAGVVKIHAK